MGILSSLGKGIAMGLDYLSVAFTKPIQTAKAAISPTKTIKEDVIKPHFEQPLAKQITQTLTATAAYAGAIVGGAALGAASKAGTLGTTLTTAAKAVIPATAKGKVIAAVAAPVVISTLASSEKARTAVINAPSELAQFGADLGQLIQEPSIQKAKELVKESPIISSLVGAAAVAGVGLGTAGVVSTILNTQAIKENTKVKAGAGNITNPETAQYEGAGTGKERIVQTEEEMPVTPQTSTISTGKTRRKPSRKAKIEGVRQNVRVEVINSSRSTGLSLTKKYIKGVQLTS